ncbi:hypothetical protein BJX66DRAFT_314080 [Aspergillus keveii]|uniref:Uncharacterized protein n=1 Tax=Aspergillus keveii TaxID=714993 RepID=A0ABR4FRJ0_9EURO
MHPVVYLRRRMPQYRFCISHWHSFLLTTVFPGPAITQLILFPCYTCCTETQASNRPIGHSLMLICLLTLDDGAL